MLGPYRLVLPALGFVPRSYQGTTYPAGEVVTAQNPLLVVDQKILSPGHHRKDEYEEATFILAMGDP